MIEKIDVKFIDVMNSATAGYIVNITHHIPEFEDSYPKEVYLERMQGKKSLILIAYINKELAGFKLGYEKNNELFYSWMGGVVPKFRKQGVAKQLAREQEVWARKNGYEFIGMKTRNYLKNMLHFALSNSFYITGLEQHNNPMENRILLEKALF